MAESWVTLFECNADRSLFQDGDSNLIFRIEKLFNFFDISCFVCKLFRVGRIYNFLPFLRQGVQQPTE